MPSDRWRRVEELCHAALALEGEERAAFLAEACVGDETLRREVESLIAQDRHAAGFMSVPAAAIAAPTVLHHPAGTLVGQRFGGYTIRALLGVGGMGEVYRAYDETLAREVAIKVLPPLYTADPQRQARLEREARMLATLNHPHIAAIYGVEQMGGARALVLELVEGKTLAERIAAASPNGGVAIDEALGIARQITDALSAAHDKGIVHRDLKPANIKITPDGVVKVLDFGLAKAANPDDAPPDLIESRDGTVFGTAAYMSPEQARSQSVDRRTDIWAFGCVLFETLTGRVAFAGDTVSDTIVAILQREPDWSALPPATPTAVRRILLRCLAKDAKQRLRDIADVRIELDAVDEVLPSVTEVGTASRPSDTTRSAWLPWVALIALAVGIVIWETVRPTVAPDPLANAAVSRFTDWEGTEEAAEISPDGKFVAFLADRAGQFDIWLSQVGSRSFSNRTGDVEPLAPGGLIVRKLGFSWDGADLWFNPGDGKALMLMPMTGGPPRAFLGQGANTPAWSPDGAHVAYVYKPDRNDPMYVVDRTFGDRRQILPPGLNKINNPAWSPDGEWIYFVAGPEPQDEIDVDVWRVRAAGGSPERLTHLHTAVNFLTVLNSRTVLYVARAEDWSGPWLWTLDVDRKVSRRVFPGIDQVTSVSASRDGSRVVATVANPSATLWRVPLRDRPVGDDEAQPYQLPVPRGRTQAPRFGDKALFFLSAGGSGDGLWKIEGDNVSEVWRNVDGALSEPPAVSPDGQRLAVVVRREGKRHLSIMLADGTNRQTLAPSIEVDGVAGQGTADWSPDGTQIVVGGHDAQGSALFVIPVNGGPAIRLLDGKWVNPVWSPAGDVIVYSGRSLIGQVEIRAVRPRDRAPIALPDVWVRPGGYRFLPDGTGLVYLPRIYSTDFLLFDFGTKHSRPLTHLSNQGPVKTFDITHDGKFIVFDRLRQNSDVVLIELPK